MTFMQNVNRIFLLVGLLNFLFIYSSCSKEDEEEVEASPEVELLSVTAERVGNDLCGQNWIEYKYIFKYSSNVSLSNYYLVLDNDWNFENGNSGNDLYDNDYRGFNVTDSETLANVSCIDFDLNNYVDDVYKLRLYESSALNTIKAESNTVSIRIDKP